MTQYPQDQCTAASLSRQVDLWYAQLANGLWADPSRLRALSEEEKGRAQAFRFATHRWRFEAADVALRVILSHYVRCDPERLVFQTGQHGKPRIASMRTDISFNMSHSGDVAVVAVTRGADVGVDIECVNTYRSDVLEVARRWFSSDEPRR